MALGLNPSLNDVYFECGTATRNAVDFGTFERDLEDMFERVFDDNTYGAGQGLNDFSYAEAADVTGISIIADGVGFQVTAQGVTYGGANLTTTENITATVQVLYASALDGSSPPNLEFPTSPDLIASWDGVAATTTVSSDGNVTQLFSLAAGTYFFAVKVYNGFNAAGEDPIVVSDVVNYYPVGDPTLAAPSDLAVYYNGAYQISFDDVGIPADSYIIEATSPNQNDYSTGNITITSTDYSGTPKTASANPSGYIPSSGDVVKFRVKETKSDYTDSAYSSIVSVTL